MARTHAATLLLLVVTVGVASAYMLADPSPAINWFSTCMQRETGLDIIPQCQDSISDSAALVMRALVDPQNLTRDDSRALWTMCTRQPLSVGQCWKDFFWQYRVFTDSMSRESCSAAAQDLVTATAASMASTMCLFDEESEEPGSCLLDVARALDTAGLLQPLRSLEHVAQLSVPDVGALCGALQATGCCGRSVLDTIATVSEALCLGPLGKVLRDLPQTCSDKGMLLPMACSKQQSSTHIHDFGNFGASSNCSNATWYHEDFSCVGYDAHLDQCPSSVCEAVCGMRVSTAVMEVNPQADGQDGDDSDGLSSMGIGLIVGGTALAVIAVGTLLCCCIRMVAIRRKRGSGVEPGLNGLRYNTLDDSTPKHSDGVVRPSAESSANSTAQLNPLKSRKSLKSMASNANLNKLAATSMQPRTATASGGAAMASAANGQEEGQDQPPSARTQQGTDGQMQQQQHQQSGSSSSAPHTPSASGVELGLIRAFVPEQPATSGQEDGSK